MMLFYRLGRRLRGRRSVADGAALALSLDGGPTVHGPWLDDRSHTPPHGDPLLTGGPATAH